MRHHDQIAAVAVGQRAALAAGQRFARTELVLPAPESGHALAAAASVASGHDAIRRAPRGVLVCVSGHGLLDLSAYDDLLAGAIDDSQAGAEALLAATAALRPVVTHELTEVS
jgi:tryptophan synthase beta chain